MKNITLLVTLMVICTGCNQGQLVPSLMYAKNLTSQPHDANKTQFVSNQDH